jgi:hypothetical protein
LNFNIETRDSCPILSVDFSFAVSDTHSTLKDVTLEIIVTGSAIIKEKKYEIRCKHFFETSRICFYTQEAVQGIVRQYKDDIQRFFLSAINTGLDFSMAQEKLHLVLVGGERWHKEEERHDFKAIKEGSCIVCGRL